MAYEQFFGLKDTPFRLTPDPAYYFPSDVHKEALQTLLYSIRAGEGFVQITGEPGTGKTLILRTILQQLGDEVTTALILNPRLSPSELLRVGGTSAVPIDVRIIGATAHDLKEAVREGTFRQDLLFRLNVVNIHMPNLTDRKSDIPLLTYHFLEKFRKQMNKKIAGISEGAMTLLDNYAFPGNVRELENIVERAVALCRDDTIQPHDLPQDLVDLDLHVYSPPHSPLLRLEELERDYISHVLRSTGGNRAQTAQILGIDRTSLWRKIKKFELE